jgi:hypothetical protein
MLWQLSNGVSERPVLASRQFRLQHGPLIVSYLAETLRRITESIDGLMPASLVLGSGSRETSAHDLSFKAGVRLRLGTLNGQGHRAPVWHGYPPPTATQAGREHSQIEVYGIFYPQLLINALHRYCPQAAQFVS